MIHVDALDFAYPNADNETLHDLSFEVGTGEVFGFLGPSGAGKSTTQKVLTGLLDDYRGSVRVFDREVRDWDGSYYDRIGVSAESPNQYRKLTGRENLELFASLHRTETRDVEELFALVGLSDAIDRRVGAYSKGMCMRLNFVRALLHDPELVFLDEPTSGIDPGNAKRVKDAISDLRAAGTTVFLTTHDMTVADQLCDRVAFIVNGKIPLIGDPETLKRDYGSRTVRVEYQRDGRIEAARFPLDDADGNAEFRRLLGGEQIETIHTEEATLETVFLEVTGESLR